MGTTLTGTTPQDTYDSLIKVTNNGPLSSTARYLSDGLGNDSVLALSTAVVGINTSSPNTNYPLSIASASNANAIAVFGRASDNTGSIDFYQSNGSSRILEFGVSTTQVDIYNDLNTPMLFSTNATERMRITGAGNVGIGTSAPAFKLDVGGDSPVVAINRASGNQPKLAFALSGTEYGSIVSSGATGENRFSIGPSVGWGGYHTFYTNTFERFRITDNGVTFNGDTAAANALDDYEEGTWTMSVAPSSSGTITLDSGVNAGSYTKIGRQVTVTGLAEVLSVSSPVGSIVVFSGLPFAIGSRNLDYDTRLGGSVTVSSAGTIVPRAFAGFENQSSFNIYVDASTIAAGNQILISFTYIV